MKKRTKRKAKNNNSFRSGLEKEICDQLKKEGITYDYEPKWGKLKYIIPQKEASYLPDFYITTKSGKKIVIECKGIWVYVDRLKHYLVRKARPDLDIRFVFSNSKSKIRKGSPTTYADICNGKGRGIFKDQVWKYSDKRIPKAWLEE